MVAHGGVGSIDLGVASIGDEDKTGNEMDVWHELSNNRRECLRRMACGFGSIAATAMACTQPGSSGISLLADDAASRIQAGRTIPRAKRIIFLFMQGGVSQVDSFDYKPLLQAKDGVSAQFEDARMIANTGNRQSSQRLMASPWTFRPYGSVGKYVSDLFPQMAQHVDDLCFIHSMRTEGVAHGPATLFLHCGATNSVRPSLGSWVSYGLGSENENLPAFVSLAPSMGNGGARNFGHAFLPAMHQGTPLGQAGSPIEQLTIQHLNTDPNSFALRSKHFEKLQELNRKQQQFRPGQQELEAVIHSYELAWRMQATAPDLFQWKDEDQRTLDLYGIGQKETDDFGRKCLLARRLSESGVRFIQVTYGDNTANPAWDQHSNLPKHAEHAKAVDRPIAGLLQDLKERGLLEDTLVWWGGEFGRTPYAEKNGTGRDHNPGGFTTWLAGGGVRGGFSYGETDELGHQSIGNMVHMHDLHATLLHLLGIDHEQLTFRHAGRDYRMTDVYGKVIHEIVAHRTPS